MKYLGKNPFAYLLDQRGVAKTLTDKSVIRSREELDNTYDREFGADAHA